MVSVNLTEFTRYCYKAIFAYFSKEQKPSFTQYIITRMMISMVEQNLTNMSLKIIIFNIYDFKNAFNYWQMLKTFMISMNGKELLLFGCCSKK